MICLVICSEGKEEKVRRGEEEEDEMERGAVGMEWVDSAIEQYSVSHT